MRRRAFITLVGGAAAYPLAARAQQPAMPVVGFLHSGSPGPWRHAVTALLNALRNAGFADGETVTIEYRWAEGRFDQIPALARDLVQRKVSLILLGGGEVVAQAAKAATTTIPIVFVIGNDPVQQGIVASLNRPGSNITGATFLSVELRPKLVELIQELLPAVKSIALVGNPNRSGFEKAVGEVVGLAKAKSLDVRLLKAANDLEIEAAFAEARQSTVGAMLFLSDPVYVTWREQIARLQLLHGIPVLHSSRENVVAGALVSYGADLVDSYRHAAGYAARILRGEKPEDLPVIQPTKFELVINIKTAKALGLTVPPTLLARADEVIE